MIQLSMSAVNARNSLANNLVKTNTKHENEVKMDCILYWYFHKHYWANKFYLDKLDNVCRQWSRYGNCSTLHETSTVLSTCLN